MSTAFATKTFQIEVLGTWTRNRGQGFNLDSPEFDEERDSLFKVTVTVEEYGGDRKTAERAIAVAEQAVLDEMQPNIDGCTSRLVAAEAESWARTAVAKEIDGERVWYFKRECNCGLAEGEEVAIN